MRDRPSPVYITKGIRWKFIKLLIKLLRVEAELDRAIVAHDWMAYRRGQWTGFDKVLSWINEQEVKTMKKSELYHAVMEMRPE